MEEVLLKAKQYNDWSKSVWQSVAAGLAPENSLKLAMNMDSDWILGKLLSRFGSTLVGVQLVAGQSVLGVHNYRNSAIGNLASVSSSISHSPSSSLSPSSSISNSPSASLSPSRSVSSSPVLHFLLQAQQVLRHRAQSVLLFLALLQLVFPTPLPPRSHHQVPFLSAIQAPFQTHHQTAHLRDPW